MVTALKITQTKEAQRVLYLILGLNLLVSAMEISWGFYTNTLSLTADGFHSLMDAVSSVIAIIALGYAMQPADKNHPYGHHKYEALASIMVSFFIFMTCLEIVSLTADRLFMGGEAPVFSIYSYAIKAVVIGINFFVAWYEKKKAVELNNQLLLADSQHTMSDIYVSFSVLGSLIAIQMGWPLVDMIIAGAITLIIFKAGFDIIASNLGSLVDETVLSPEEIYELVLSVDGVLGCHHIRSRGMENSIFIDMHIQVNADISIKKGHQIAHNVEDALRDKYGEVISEVLIHVEEEGDDDTLLPHEKVLESQH